jgi:hypothetical protein
MRLDHAINFTRERNRKQISSILITFYVNIHPLALSVKFVARRIADQPKSFKFLRLTQSFPEF